MAVLVTFQGTPRSSADVTIGWEARNITGSVAFGVLTDGLTPFEGAGCLAWDHDIENGGLVFDLSAGTDLSDTHVYVRAGCFTASNLAVSNPGTGQAGVYIMAEDTSGNRGYWHVGGSDTYFGGFETFVAYIGSTPDTNSGTAPNNTQIRYIGLGFNHTQKSKLAENCFVDVIRTATSGQGLQVTTTASTVATWDDIVTGDAAGYYGIIRKVAGAYLVQGPISFGTNSGGNIEFADSQQSVVFLNRAVSSTHYKLSVVGGASSTTTWTDGTKAGTAGIRGSTIRSNGPDFTLDFDDFYADINLYGTSFIGMGAGQTLFPSSHVGTPGESLNCSWVDCGKVQSGIYTIGAPTFIDAGSTALVISEPDVSGVATHNITSPAFIACTYGVEHPVYGDYTYDDFQFTGSATADVWNSSTPVTGGSITSGSTSSQWGSGETAAGQSFFATGSGNLTSVGFTLTKTGTVSGSMRAKVYTVTGSAGSYKPGTLLATSADLDCATVTTTQTIFYFPFWESNQISITSSTNYFFVIEAPNGDTNNHINVIRTLTDVYASGNLATYTPSTWTSSNSTDFLLQIVLGGGVQINSTGSNPTTYANSFVNNTTRIVSAVTLTMVVKDEGGSVISGAYAYIDDNDSSPYILNTTTNGSGVASTAYTGGSVSGSRWRVRKYGYKQFKQLVDIGATDITLPVTLIADPQQV